MPPDPSLLAGTDDPDRSPGYPFRGLGLLVRVAPFAAIAALAEASLALTPGPAPALAVAVSLVLLFGWRRPSPCHGNGCRSGRR